MLTAKTNNLETERTYEGHGCQLSVFFFARSNAFSCLAPFLRVSRFGPFLALFTDSSFNFYALFMFFGRQRVLNLG